ncbi:7-cyano-7-deazaguanine synthase [bacterium]|nr:7-cyano-7-deazaguanine synthase [bacterium]MCI0604764.1 7-cyano-7-deazaguanine synthase [bacterium]
MTIMIHDYSCALVLLSGGLDSGAALAWAQNRFQQIKAISYHYYLRPFRERLAVLRLLQHFPADLIEVPLPFLKEAADFVSKFSSKAPEGYISNRNMIFYSIAIYFAEMHQCTAIVGGHTAEDQDAFPDAGSRFVQALQDLANQALQIRKVQIELPLAGYTKLQVLEKAIEWKVPLNFTWSCYWNQTEPCGICISCTERAEAFRQLGMNDPLCTT